jgi:hypothetical protein
MAASFRKDIPCTSGRDKKEEEQAVTSDETMANKGPSNDMD